MQAVAGVAAVEAAAEVLYVEGDVIPEGKAVGDVKTAAVAAVAAVDAVAAVAAVGKLTVTKAVLTVTAAGSLKGIWRACASPLGLRPAGFVNDEVVRCN